MPERKPKPEINFEKSLKQLEDIVQRMEAEDLPLDQALKLFAQGQVLARSCEEQLQAAESKVRQLMENPAGELVESELEEDASTGAAAPPTAPPPQRPPALDPDDDVAF